MKRKQNLPARAKKSKPKLLGFDITPAIVVIVLLGAALTIYIAYRASLSNRKLFSVSLLAMFGGLLFESFRVSHDRRTILSLFAGSYLFSLISFIPGKTERHYDFENHIFTWPYALLFFYALAFTAFHMNKVTAKLTEGITLLLSLSFIYWMIDYGYTNYTNWFALSLEIILLLLSAFSVLNALTNFPLSKKVRLALSIWSTVILFVFAIDNIVRVFQNPEIENSYMADGLYIFLQYFLLGVSAVYIMQNFLFLVAFLPERDRSYKDVLDQGATVHIERYSDQQVLLGQSLFCIFYTGVIYWLNYKYQFLPRYTMIWLVIVTFPLILNIKNIVQVRKERK